MKKLGLTELALLYTRFFSIKDSDALQMHTFYV